MNYFEALRKTSWIFWNTIMAHAKEERQNYRIINSVITTSLLSIWYFVLLIIQALMYPIAAIIGLVVGKLKPDLPISDDDINALEEAYDKMYKDSWELRK